MITREQWQWYGTAAHFIGADQCRFHMVTRVGTVLVSSIGDNRNAQGKQQQIGYQRTYETMVFRVVPDTPAECGCGLPPIDFNEIDAAAYNDCGDATRGHVAMCEKWATDSAKVES